MAETKKEPTPAEAMLFYSIVKNTRNKADVDWDAVATEAGFKNAEVAKVRNFNPPFHPLSPIPRHLHLFQVRFGQVKRKLGIANEGGPTTPKKSPAASKVTKPRSTGKPRASRAKVKKEVKEEEKDEDEDHLAQSETPDVKNRGIKTEEEEGPAHQLKEEMNTTYHYEEDMTDPF